MKEFRTPNIDREGGNILVPKNLTRDQLKDIWRSAAEEAEKYIDSIEVQNWLKGRMTHESIPVPEAILETGVAKLRIEFPYLTDYHLEQYRKAFRERCKQGTRKNH